MAEGAIDRSTAMQPLAVAVASAAITPPNPALTATGTVTAPASGTAPAAAQAASGGTGISFGQVLSALNPLQYLPVVGPIYRAITGTTTQPVFSIAGSIIGGVLMGGPFGALGAIGGTIVEQIFRLGFDPAASKGAAAVSPESAAAAAGPESAAATSPAPAAATPPSTAAAPSAVSATGSPPATPTPAVADLPPAPIASHVFTMLPALGQTITLAPPTGTTPAMAVAAYRNVSAYALG